MTTTWNINKLICKTSEGNLSNVVYKILWECKQIDANNNSIIEQGLCTLSQPDPNTFIQYNSLNKSDVVNWVKSTLGQTLVNQIESRLTQRLIESVNTISLDPPFTN